MAGISRKALLDALEARLSGYSWLTVYPGEVTSPPPILGAADGTPDPYGRVSTYAVLFPSPGTPNSDADLADAHQDLDWTVQISVVSGYLPDLLYGIDQMDGLLHMWAPVIDGIACDGLRPPAGYDPGPARRSDEISPPRFWVPMQYRLTATR